MKDCLSAGHNFARELSDFVVNALDPIDFWSIDVDLYGRVSQPFQTYQVILGARKLLENETKS